MSDASIDVHHAFFAKTAIGLQEIQSRSLGLTSMVRRLLILVDGKRSGQDLAVFVSGHAVATLLKELLALKCIEVVASAGAAKVNVPVPTTPDITNFGSMGNALAALPSPKNRSVRDLEMARNFMTNTINMEFGQHMRVSLIKAIAESKTTPELRDVYPLWLSTMASSRSATKELPALNEKLFRVL